MDLTKNRVILHCDMNGFFASVELLDYPELRDKPMAVCGDPESRHGIILAKNEIAKRYGIVTAETLWQARKKCPDLQTVPPHHKKYQHYSRLINEIYLQYTDMVEPFSVDESWLDVTASQKLFGNGKQIADKIRHHRADTGCQCTQTGTEQNAADQHHAVTEMNVTLCRCRNANDHRSNCRQCRQQCCQHKLSDVFSCHIAYPLFQ